MNKKDIAYLAIRALVGSAVSAVITNAIKVTTPTNMRLGSKLMVGIGTFVITTVAGEICGDYVINEIETAQQEIKQNIDKLKAEAKRSSEAVDGEVING